MHFAPTITTPQLVVAILFAVFLTIYAFMLLGKWLMKRQKSRFRVQVCADHANNNILLVIDGSAYRLAREADIVELLKGISAAYNALQAQRDKKTLGILRKSRRLGLALGTMRDGIEGNGIYFQPGEVCFFEKSVDYLVDSVDSDTDDES